MSGRAKTALAVLFFAAWFLGQTWRGLFVDFTEDDLMNIYHAWGVPWRQLALANLTPFTSIYRPVGSLFYHAMYSAAGLHALPFRIFAYAVMLLNIWLVYRAAWLLTGSEWTGLLCALLFSYHKRMYALFVNGGTIYDLLSMTFFLLALGYYVSERRRGNVTGWRLVAFCALYTLAINSKEMAAALPAILLIYEIVYHRQALKLGWKWMWERRALWIAGGMTVAAFAFRRMRGSSFFGVADYAMHFTVAQYWSTTLPLVGQLFFLQENTLGRVEVAAIFAGAVGLGLWLRDRAMVLGAAIGILAPLPVNFIAYRGFFVMYLPLFGWALFFAALVEKIPKRVPRVAIFAAIAAALFTIEFTDRTWEFDFPRRDEEKIHRMRKDLATLHDATAKPRRVLFLRQTMDPDGWVPLYIVRLLYRDPDIKIDVTGSSHAPREIDLKSYDLVVDFENGRYVRVN